MADHAYAWWAKAILIGAVAGAAMLPLGALGTRFGIWSFQTGFLGLAAGVILAVFGLVLGVVALIVASKRKLPENKPPIGVGLAVSALILAVMGFQLNAAYSVPPIHNISTDTSDPPQFDKVVTLRGEGTNPLAYDSETIAPLQNEHYPWVKTLLSADSVENVHGRAVAVLEDLGLEVVNSDPEGGLIEATATTFWFGFKDDVAVRVRATGSGSVIDVRSVSRVGLSDLGANARRIGEILTALGAK